jgi:hypothetical protein
VLTVSDAALVTGGGAKWTPLATDRFAAPQGEARFAGAPGRRTIALVREPGDTLHFDEVQASLPASANSDYLGSYASDELDAILTIVQRDGKLFLQRRPYDELSLQPVYRDDFRASGGLGSLRFARDGSGKVTGFSVFAGRVLDVRFTRTSGGKR